MVQNDQEDGLLQQLIFKFYPSAHIPHGLKSQDIYCILCCASIYGTIHISTSPKICNVWRRRLQTFADSFRGISALCRLFRQSGLRIEQRAIRCVVRGSVQKFQKTRRVQNTQRGRCKAYCRIHDIDRDDYYSSSASYGTAGGELLRSRTYSRLTVCLGTAVRNGTDTNAIAPVSMRSRRWGLSIKSWTALSRHLPMSAPASFFENFACGRPFSWFFEYHSKDRSIWTS